MVKHNPIIDYDVVCNHKPSTDYVRNLDIAESSKIYEYCVDPQGNGNVDIAELLNLCNKISQKPNDILNFDYAPVQVIIRFHTFYEKHRSLASALNELLKVGKRLKRRYEFLNVNTTHEMLVRIKRNENVLNLQKSIYSLCKYVDESPFDDVISVMEELVMQPDAVLYENTLGTIKKQQLLNRRVKNGTVELKSNFVVSKRGITKESEKKS